MSQKATPKIRLFVDVPLQSNEVVKLNEDQSHYLCNVMRLDVGSPVICFNGCDGEFQCNIEVVSKKCCVLRVAARLRPFKAVPDVWILFAPVKKDCTDFIIEKATELGAAKIIPVQTRYTVVERVRTERYSAQAAEASEQSRRLDIPKISELTTLADLLSNWDEKRCLYFMDETGNGQPAAKVFAASSSSPAAILVGPEGGFAAEELNLLRGLPFARAVSLGPRILRAETAVAAALSVWQALAGDWLEGEKI